MKSRGTIFNWWQWCGIGVLGILVIAGVWLAIKRKASDRPPRPIACGVPCGTERWAVKTLSDEQVSCVDFTPKQATVSWLVSQPTPERLADNTRAGSLECQLWQITGRLLEYKAEDDGDCHLVLSDLQRPDQTMIVEIPDATCQGACASSHEQEIVQAREAFTRAFGQPTKRFHRLEQPMLVTVTGVGFFDFRHGQKGLAPNGIELHPVTGFKVERRLDNVLSN